MNIRIYICSSGIFQEDGEEGIDLRLQGGQELSHRQETQEQMPVLQVIIILLHFMKVSTLYTIYNSKEQLSHSEAIIYT